MCLSGALGGPKLQFALVDALPLPSISGTRAHSLLLLIEACISFPVLSEVLHNYTSLHHAGVLWETTNGQSQTLAQGRLTKKQRQGFQIMMDELALEEQPWYDTRRDTILGIACETAHEVDLSVVTLENLKAAADALEHGSLAVAKEATMVGLATYGYNDYATFPVLISGTNKSEQEAKQAQWIHLMIDAWDTGKPPDGADIRGAIWRAVVPRFQW